MNVKENVEKVREYFKEVYLETKRVTFPSRKETMKGTYVVLITVVIAAAFLGVVDVGLAKIIRSCSVDNSMEKMEASTEKKWYVVHTYSGYEQKVKEALEERIKTSGMEDHFAEIIVPSEVIMERVKGQAKKSQRTIFPGYIIVQMDMNEDTWYLVRNTPKVTGFVGYGMKPTPLPDDEIKDLVSAIQEGKGKIKPKIRFDKGDNVKVIEGPFSNFTGSVEEIKPEKGKVKVLLNIFGRTTPVELDFMQIEKM